MSNFVFNHAKGMVSYYATLPEPDAAFIIVPMTSTETDIAMVARTTLDDVLGGGTTEQTTVGRQTLTGLALTVDDALNTSKVDADDFTYVAATGAPISAFVVCYVPDNTAPDDTTTIPLTKHDFVAVPSGADIDVLISANGIFSATSSAL